MAEKKTFTRQELYELVWKTPMRHLACQFGLSDVGLVKTCKRHHIPTPPAGYWAKKRHGKATRRIPLPPCDKPALATITLRRYEEAGNMAEIGGSHSSSRKFYDPELARLADAEARGEDPILLGELVAITTSPGRKNQRRFSGRAKEQGVSP